MRLISYLFIIFLFSTLVSCATISTPATSFSKKNLTEIKHWNLSGLIAIRTKTQAFSANWQWEQTSDQYIITMSGPLGTSAFKLLGNPNNVLLQMADGNEVHAKTPETLLQEQLGWQIPVSYLYYWIRGLMVPGITAQPTFNSSHQLQTLQQAGWSIRYVNYTFQQSFNLPNKILLENPLLSVKLLIQNFQFS